MALITRHIWRHCVSLGVLCGAALWLLSACAAPPPTPQSTVSPRFDGGAQAAAPTTQTVTLQPSRTTTATPEPTPTREATSTAVPQVVPDLAGCTLPTVVAPPIPAATVAFGALDPATGLHVTGRPQVIDLASYRLVVSGKVDHPLRLTYDEVRCLPKIQTSALLICVGVFEDEATWSGAQLKAVVDLAGAQVDAKEVHLVSADSYHIVVPLDTAREAQNLLAYEVDGHTLPVLHGFPLRAVFPDMTGGKWLKWLVEIEVN